MKEQPETWVTHFWKNNFKSRKILCTKNFTYTKKSYVHEIAAVNLSKMHFMKNANKTCKPNNRDLNRDWEMKSQKHIVLLTFEVRIKRTWPKIK